MSGFYSAFSNIDPNALHLIPLSLEYVSCLCPKHTHTLGECSMDYIPSNYLITLRSTKRIRLRILPKDTNMLALAGSNSQSSALESCTVPLDHMHYHNEAMDFELFGNSSSLLFHAILNVWIHIMQTWCILYYINFSKITAFNFIIFKIINDTHFQRLPCVLFFYCTLYINWFNCYILCKQMVIYSVETCLVEKYLLLQEFFRVNFMSCKL